MYFVYTQIQINISRTKILQVNVSSVKVKFLSVIIELLFTDNYGLRCGCGKPSTVGL